MQFTSLTSPELNSKKDSVVHSHELNSKKDSVVHSSPYIAPCQITLAQQNLPANSHRNLLNAVATPGYIDSQAVQTADLRAAVKMNPPKYSVILPDVIVEEHLHHPDLAAITEVSSSSTPNVCREADDNGPVLVRLVKEADFLRLQDTVSELNDFLLHQSELLLAITSRDYSSGKSTTHLAASPLHLSDSHIGKIEPSTPIPMEITVQVTFEMTTFNDFYPMRSF
jgi:hypothetical protein